MKFEITREWLAKKLAHCDDTDVGAGGTDQEQFRRDVEARTVTPSVLAAVPTDLGKAVRFVRERQGWSRSELAELADIDETEVAAIESDVGYEPSPRTVVNLADACHFSRARLKELAGHVKPHESTAANDNEVRFAAKSNGIHAIGADEYEAVRALVDVLSEKSSEKP